MFEKEYIQAVDKIHPREDMLKRLQENWAKEQPKPQNKLVPFPAWLKALSVAAGLVLCVGLGVGGALLLSPKGRFAAPQAAEAPMLMESKAAVTSAEYEYAIEEAAIEEAPAMGAAPAELTTQDILAAVTPMEKGAEAFVPRGKVLQSEGDLLAAFDPATAQIHWVSRKGSSLKEEMTLTLNRGRGEIVDAFWHSAQVLALEQQPDMTVLLPFDVTNVREPRIGGELSQSGSLRWAGPDGYRFYVVTDFVPTEQTPVPLINGEPLALQNISLEGGPAASLTVVTVYDPTVGGFAEAYAMLGQEGLPLPEPLPTPAAGAVPEGAELLAYEEATGRFLTWEGDRICLYTLLDGTAALSGTLPLSPTEGDRVLAAFLEDGVLVFHGSGAILCNGKLARLYTLRY